MANRVTCLKEVTRDLDDGETLCLQLAVYNYTDGGTHTRFRFIRKDVNGRLKSQRGQAGIPKLSLILDMAKEMQKTLTTEVSLLQSMGI